MNNDKIKKWISELTLEEKAGLCSGNGNWYTKAVERLGIPAIRMNDGPHGLRLQEGESNDISGGGDPAICFPLACATAASFDRNLLHRLGKELGEQCLANNVQMLLGPGINIKRNPLCGRNFEYFSEDPLLTGELGLAFVNGVQSQGVGTSVKHFFANNQEHRRMDSSSEMDERTKREIYLAAFERIVKGAQPWTVMAAYNQVDNVFCTENAEYLQEVLRRQWGFEGAVVSDWGATMHRAKAVAAGCDLTMPGAADTDAQLIKAVQDGSLAEADLDAACANILKLVLRGVENRRENAVFDLARGEALAEEIASQSIVLLKNDAAVLPLNEDQKIAFIGEFAQSPRYQGSGSSRINSTRVVSALDAIGEMGLGENVIYAKGYDGEETDVSLLNEALSTAQQAEVAVLFVGLPSQMESEGFDRKHLRLPESHNALIWAVSAIQPNTIVVLHNGAPVEMPWVHDVKGIVEAYLGGQGVGKAVVNVLYGKENPSGRLPESFPLRLEDTPSYLSFPGEAGHVPYTERMFVGYRYYESKAQPVLFPFGHGLSYTTFAYANLRTDAPTLSKDKPVTVSVDVTNTGAISGREVVQLYYTPCKCEYLRPVKQLCAFDKVLLTSGKTKTVSFELQYRDLACWSPELNDWFAEPGSYTLQIGLSASKSVLDCVVQVQGEPLSIVKEYTESTLMKDFIMHPFGKTYFADHVEHMFTGMAKVGVIPEEALAQMKRGDGTFEAQGLETMMALPISLMLSFSGISEEEKQSLFQAMNTANG
ncbi:MAG: glycosyl hydrolase [Clostridiales bacterium]|nr:glycosyl hydrolase [Clostridiales bacterium]